MKSSGSFHVILWLYPLWICLIALALIIHSCKKENKVSQPVISDAIVGQARQWYESNYAKATTRSTVRTQAAGTAVQDWSKTFSPDWAKASKFMQDSLIFIELPALKKGDMAISKKQMDPNKFDFSRSGNLTSLIIVNKKGAFYIYAMTILADSAYLKSDYGKIKNNTYRKREKDFTGSVLYHRLDGSFVNGWRYNNGVITGTIKPSQAPATTTRGLIHNGNQGTKRALVYECVTDILTTYWEQCYYLAEDIYELHPFNCNYWSTSTSTTTCNLTTTPDNTGGGNGSPPAPPPPCTVPPPPPAGAPVSVTAHKTMIRVLAPPPPPPPGGIVDPVNQIGTATTPCVTVTPIVPLPDTTGCAKATALSAMAANAAQAAQDATILSNTTSTGIENGASENLSSWPGTTYLNTPITSGTASSWPPPTPTWDAANGYTIGFKHGHPGGDAPSPQDVAAIVYPINTNHELVNAGPAALQYYKANANVQAETTAGTYVVTISNWTTIQNTITSSFSTDADKIAFNTNYAKIANDYRTATGASLGDATAYALTQLFPGAITIYFKPAGSTTYIPLTVVTDAGGNQTLTILQCP